jgi:hypothetical protein
MNKFVIAILTALLFSSCDLDSNLFNPEIISEYKLPGNTIPDSLIEQVSFLSEGNRLYGFWIKSNAGETLRQSYIAMEINTIWMSTGTGLCCSTKPG